MNENFSVVVESLNAQGQRLSDLELDSGQSSFPTPVWVDSEGEIVGYHFGEYTNQYVFLKIPETGRIVGPVYQRGNNSPNGNGRFRLDARVYYAESGCTGDLAIGSGNNLTYSTLSGGATKDGYLVVGFESVASFPTKSYTTVSEVDGSVTCTNYQNYNGSLYRAVVSVTNIDSISPPLELEWR
jgi:hypothetical protein